MISVVIVDAVLHTIKYAEVYLCVLRVHEAGQNLNFTRANGTMTEGTMMIYAAGFCGVIITRGIYEATMAAIPNLADIRSPQD